MRASTSFWRNRIVDFAAGVLTGLVVTVVDAILDHSFASAPLAGLLVFVVMLFTLPAVRHLSERRWTDATPRPHRSAPEAPPLSSTNDDD